MNKPLTMFGALTLSAVAFVRAVSRLSSETQIYAGEIFGDRMTETSISGSPPRLHESTNTAQFQCRYLLRTKASRPT
jgi:hypothetical protein